MQREVRDALANILGECSAHADRYGPEAKAAFERIKEWAQKAVGTKKRSACGLPSCDGYGVWTCGNMAPEPCEAHFGVGVVAEWEAAGRPEVRAWLDARAKAATVAAADPHRTHSRGLLTMGDNGATCLGDGCGVHDESKPTTGKDAA